MRLIDELAARRCLYPPPIATAPAVMVIDVPEKWAGESLPLGRFYPVIIETDEELAEFEAYLAAPRTVPGPPDLLATRPSNLAASAITFFEFSPPAAGWPWLLICHWPADLAAATGMGNDDLARGAYTMETYASWAELVAAAGIFAGILGGNTSVHSCDELGTVIGRA